MEIIDSQVHCYDRPRPDASWTTQSPELFKADGGEMAVAMAAVGVTGAIMVSPFSVYGFDTGYARALALSHAGPFGLVVPIDATAPQAAEEIAEWASVPGAVGIRLLGVGHEYSSPDTVAALVRAAETAGRHGLAVNLVCPGSLAFAELLTTQCPDVQFVLDHLGLPIALETVPIDPFADLSRVIALAAKPNLAIKISGACALSQAGWPFADLWPHLARLFDAYGLERCLWGSDWTRVLRFVTYGEAVEAFRTQLPLSDGDRALLMGRSLRRIYRWSPACLW